MNFGGAGFWACAREAAENADLLRDAPVGRSVRRVDEVKAAKRAVVRYLFEDHPEFGDPSPEPRQLEAQKGA